MQELLRCTPCHSSPASGDTGLRSILLKTVFAVDLALRSSADQDTFRLVLVQEHVVTSDERVVAGKLYEHAACSNEKIENVVPEIVLALCVEESRMVRNHDSVTSAERSKLCAN